MYTTDLIIISQIYCKNSLMSVCRSNWLFSCRSVLDGSWDSAQPTTAKERITESWRLQRRCTYVQHSLQTAAVSHGQWHRRPAQR